MTALLRKFMFSGVMMTAVVIPYLMSTGGEWWAAAKQRVASLTASSPSTASESAPGSGDEASQFGAYNSTPTAQQNIQGHSLGGNYATVKTPIEGYGALDLAEVINFNASPSWVMSRWPRVTVGLAELDMQGYRVPLVTGTGADDIAGSLTYYFDMNQQVKLIHFRGKTGDPRKLVHLVMSQYKFLPQPTGNPSLQLYQVKWNGKPTSELQIQTASVLRASDPYSRFSVELALQRP